MAWRACREDGRGLARRHAEIAAGSTEALRDEIGSTFPAGAATRNEQALTTIRTQLDEAAFAEAWEQGQALTVDEAVALAFDSLG